MPTPEIIINPLSSALGAEISGIDLAEPLDDETWKIIHTTWLDHLMIFFRDQTITPRHQVDLAQRFGKPAIYTFIKGLPEQAEVTEILKTENDQVNFGGRWHTDTTYKQIPDRGTLL
ncbi:MAG: TauD/TfdA dioxygenase family protein, partial [Methyloligellaceae bacterium]